MTDPFRYLWRDPPPGAKERAVDNSELSTGVRIVAELRATVPRISFFGPFPFGPYFSCNRRGIANA